MPSEPSIVDFVLRVEDQEDQVEPGHEGVRQLDVLDDGALVVPLGLDGVGGGQDGGASVELADDAGLGDGEGLLLHHFVQHGTGRVAHLPIIEIIRKRNNLFLLWNLNNLITKHLSCNLGLSFFFTFLTLSKNDLLKTIQLLKFYSTL